MTAIPVIDIAPYRAGMLAARARIDAKDRAGGLQEYEALYAQYPDSAALASKRVWRGERVMVWLLVCSATQPWRGRLGSGESRPGACCRPSLPG